MEELGERWRRYMETSSEDRRQANCLDKKTDNDDDNDDDDCTLHRLVGTVDGCSWNVNALDLDNNHFSHNKHHHAFYLYISSITVNNY